MCGLPTKTSYILQDYLGTADTIIDVTGGVVETRKFDPYGNQFDPANPAGPPPVFTSAVPFGFAGHEHDAEMGLINMRGRIYDPSLGRFLSPDPIGLSPLSALGLNAYAYAANDPATLNDPTGFTTERGGDGNGDHPPIGVTIGIGGSSGSSSGSGVHYANPAPAQSGHQYKQYSAVDAATLRAQSMTVVKFT